MSLKKRGDTIIEVMMAIAIFAILSVITINLMNSGINNAQRTLEITMARNEIDSQAEALRYIHQSYIAERQLDRSSSEFRTLWDKLRDIAKSEKELETDEHDPIPFDINQISSCDEAYKGKAGMVEAFNAFVLNTRLILPDSGTVYDGNTYSALVEEIVVGLKGINEQGDERRLVAAPLYPRIVYKHSSDEGISRDIRTEEDTAADNSSSSLAEKQIYNRVARAEGIFIIAVGDNARDVKRSNYYDFYIRSCWHSIGSYTPSTLTTIVRLYNPEVIE